MAGKNSFTHGVGQHFRFPPEAPPVGGLIIIGHDLGPDGTKAVNGSHELWRADADLPPPKNLVDSIRKHGVLAPGRARKIDENTAEVVLGRDRTKACRILKAEGMEITMPMLVWPKGSSIGEIIGAINAENFARKTESVISQAEHVWMQLKAEGYFDGNVDDALKATSISTGMSTQRLRQLLTFREDQALVKAVQKSEMGKEGGLRGEAALALATIEDPIKRGKELEHIIAHPEHATVVEVRERVSFVKHAEKADKNAKKEAEKAAKDAEKAEKAAAKEAERAAKGKPAKKAKAKPAKKPSKKKPDPDAKGPGLSNALCKRLAEDQMKLGADERDLDQLVIKALKVVAKQAALNTLPGLTKALDRLGLSL